MMLLLAAAILLCSASAHQALTIMTDPRIYPRAKAFINDQYRNPNHPSPGTACHGQAMGTGPVTTLTAGTAVQGTTVAGAGHGGGHCAWFVSPDQVNWYKINDAVDCTSESRDGQRHDFVVPTNAPKQCADGCVLGWFWSPMLSGTCELYSNCWDVVIPGANGGIESSGAAKIRTPITNCVRPHTTTHLTPMLDDTGDVAPPTDTTLPPGVAAPEESDNAESCFTYTVRDGDTLGAIAATFEADFDSDFSAFDPSYLAIFEANKDTMTDPNKIEIGQVLKIPPCGTKSNGASAVAATSAASAAGAFAAAAAAVLLSAAQRN